MVYIPKNRLITNLKTEKDTWVYKDEPDVFYNGSYWKLYTGQAYTGTGPNDKPSTQREIIEMPGPVSEVPPSMIPNSNVIPLNLGDPDPVGQNDIPVGVIRDYLHLTDQSTVDEQKRNVPYTYYPQPTEKDYRLGIFERYFIVKINEDVWKEIDKSTYEKIRSGDENWTSELWRPISFMWTLSGDRNKVNRINKQMTELYEKKAGYHRGKLIQKPRKGLKRYLLNRFTKYRIGDSPEDVNSAFYVKSINKLTFEQLYKVQERAEYILSGKEPEWLNDTKAKAEANNRSVYEQALFEANWVLYKEPTLVEPEEPKSKTIWRVSRELKLNQTRKDAVVQKADYIMLDPNSDWYQATVEKAEENDRPLYEQAMREANYVLYDGNPEYQQLIKQKKEINKIVKELKLINPAKDWIKEKALFILSGENKRWLKKTKEKKRKWNSENPDDQRTLLFQCFREAQWVWDNKESKNKKYN
tara:strand:- start:1775 stop:3187 length:1413 start_codon:yes stop_codon:yes gene_type:complete